ncbi:MAG TPA: DUF3515 family protein [Intrasporangium sp.]|uniref:DUF3515 family protein n=1 Tax=Intrasporangium sp. TaxID=1925024 RepID=UPI002D794175|nr:DUF3515 family protein [Intrasporangium sp.]HET7399240.1 DUF3515 family protein [Intrasporangium sp.]
MTSACSRAVEVAVPSGADVPVCRAPAWPAAVGGRGRVETTPASAAVAAWGDPAIVARCGLAPLGPTSDPCVTVDGVDWVVRALSDGSAATTYGRDPALEVLVPAAYGPAPLLLPAFSQAARRLPATSRHCL